MRLYTTRDSTDELCNKFSDFFLDTNFTIRSGLFSVPDDVFLRFSQLDIANSRCELINFERTNAREHLGLARKFALKSCFLDPLPSELLSHCLYDLLPTIERIINWSLESSVVLSSLKRAVLPPLIKKLLLDHEQYSSFRPVSYLQFLSKVIEKVVAVRVLNYLRVNHLEECLQSAYKENHSCETALTRVHNDVMPAINNYCCAVLILLDFSAAFDAVDHNILPQRLHYRFGFKEKVLDWFRSYLENRTQFVKIDDILPLTRPLDCGVFQGSVLGPLLYLLYTAPIGDILRNYGLSFPLYADDTQVYATYTCHDSDDLAAIQDRMERCFSPSIN